MAPSSPLHLPLSLFPFLSLLLLSPALTLTASPSPSPPPSTAPKPTAGCSAELVAFSPCLPFVASPPNNLSSFPSSDCCAVFSSDLDSGAGAAACLCHPARRHAFFGFPLNSTKLYSLSSLCPPANTNASDAKGSLQSLCSGLSRLPPLQAITDPMIPRTQDPGPGPDSSSPPVKSSLIPDSDGVSDATPSPSSTTTPTNFHATHSSASKQLNNRGYWSPLGTTAFLVPIFTYICCYSTICRPSQHKHMHICTFAFVKQFCI